MTDRSIHTAKSAFSLKRMFFLSWLLSGMILAGLFPLCSVQAASADPVPVSPRPPRLVNDFAGVLGNDAVGMERVLRAFDDSTSNQITIVTVNDLGGYSPSQFAYEIGERWGVGNRKYNNGVVILIKPKNDNGAGQASIAPGYGLEAVLPDAVCKRIIDQEMIPYFRQNDYTAGVLAALQVMMPLVAGEISVKEYMPGDDGTVVFAVVFILFIVLVLLVSMLGGKGKGDRFGGGDGGSAGRLLGTWWLLNSAANSGRHSGAWGGFSGGGGFGGFGGGSFGGGGASGSW